MNSHDSNTWLALGDSYTIGEAVPLHQRWPHQIARRLSFSNPQYLATTGWTTRNLLDAIPKTTFAPPYTWVSLLIGVNNQYQGLDFSLYPAEFTELLKFAVSQTTDASHVLVLSIPDYSVTPEAQDKDPVKIQQEITQYNKANQQISEDMGARYCNIIPLSRQASEDKTLIAEDGLHPSGKMYQMWAEKILREVPFGETT